MTEPTLLAQLHAARRTDSETYDIFSQYFVGVLAARLENLGEPGAQAWREALTTARWLTDNDALEAAFRNKK